MSKPKPYDEKCNYVNKKGSENEVYFETSGGTTKNLTTASKQYKCHDEQQLLLRDENDELAQIIPTCAKHSQHNWEFRNKCCECDKKSKKGGSNPDDRKDDRKDLENILKYLNNKNPDKPDKPEYGQYNYPIWNPSKWESTGNIIGSEVSMYACSDIPKESCINENGQRVSEENNGWFSNEFIKGKSNITPCQYCWKRTDIDDGLDAERKKVDNVQNGGSINLTKEQAKQLIQQIGGNSIKSTYVSYNGNNAKIIGYNKQTQNFVVQTGSGLENISINNLMVNGKSVI